jgi:glycosyltransferase involved in cell wall biosynthesis
MNILVVTYWSFSDPLVQTYTLPYVRLIKKHLPSNSRVFLFCLTQPAFEAGDSDEDAIRKLAEEENIHVRLEKYAPFGAKMILKLPFILLKLAGICRRNRIDYIHAWCTPGGTIGYLLSKMTSIPLVLDSYEPHAEVMTEGGTWKRNGLAFRILFFFERKQAERASAVIGLTESMKQYAREKYGLELRRFFVKPACVDFTEFNHQKPPDTALKQQLGLVNKLTCVYAGKFGGIYLEQEVFDLFKAAYDHWGDRFRVLLLSRTPQEAIERYCKKSGLHPSVIVCRYVDHKEMSRYLRLADFAINPVKPIPSRRHNTSIKDGEYWAMGLPVIIPPGICDDSEIIEQNGIGSIWKVRSYDDHKRSIEEIDALLLQPRSALSQKICGIARRYRSFSNADRIYEEIYGPK